LSGRVRVDEMEGRTLVVVDDISEMVSSAVMSFSDAHRVVREVDIAVVAWSGQFVLWGAGCGGSD
jgi:hypothetical protein